MATPDDRDEDDTPEAADHGDLNERRIEELEAELEAALRDLGYFISSLCALAHLAEETCACDARITRINARLQRLR